MEPSREYPSLRSRLIGMLAIFAAIFLGLTVYLYQSSRAAFIEGLKRELSGDLRWLAATVKERPLLLSVPGAADSLAKAVSAHKGYRITIIAGDGKVIGESHVPGDSLDAIENHLDRPEVRMALRDGMGHSRRHSSTVRKDMLYVAMRLGEAGPFLRIAAEQESLNSFQAASLRVFALFLGTFLAAALVITWWISRKISSPLLQLTGEERPGRSVSESLADLVPPRWEAGFREAEVLNRAFEGYVGQIRLLAGQVALERDKLVDVLNQLEEGIVILSAEGHVLSANPSSLRLLGMEPGDAEALSGKPFHEAIPQSSLARWVKEAANPDRPPVLHLDRGPEAPFDLLCRLVPLDVAGNAREYLLTLLNITEFRHLDRIKSEFVANASHELKTPLSSIKGFAESLLEGALQDPKVREPFVRKIHNNALRLERMVQDLLSLSQLEADPVPRDPEPLPLRGYVAAAAALHREGLDSYGLRLENHVPEDVKLLMEPRDLELILNNLVGNAVKYNRPAGKIKIGVEDGGTLSLYVKDTGYGIPSEMLPRIFERFYRADAARAQKEGTGLGLAIVKHAAHKYGMNVRAESTLGEGSRFVLEIPAALVHPPVRAGSTAPGA